MKNKRGFLFVILLCILIPCIFVACGKTTTNFTSFYLQFLAKEYYSVGENVTIQIKERDGSPEYYNVYEKLDSQQYIHKHTINTQLGEFSVNFTHEGTLSVKVIPVLAGVERSSFEEIIFSVLEKDKFNIQEFYVKNNIVDLYYNVGEMRDSYDINQNIEVVFVPEYTTQRSLEYQPRESDCISMQGSVIKAVGYKEEEPFVLPIYSRENPSIISNMYFRINDGVNKKELTKIFAGYTSQRYYPGDWVRIQAMEYAGMRSAEGFIVSKKAGLEYVDLDDKAPNAEVKKVDKHGLTFYDVKVGQSTDENMDLRIYAIKNGTKSNVYTDISIQVHQRPIAAQHIELAAENRTLLLNQEYTINYTISPYNTYDKSVFFEVGEGAEEFIQIDKNGTIKSLAPTESAIIIKVISNSNPEIQAQFSVKVLNKTEAEFNLTNDVPLIQTIGFNQDIEFNIGANVSATEWILDGTVVGNSKKYTYSAGAAPFIAQKKNLVAKIQIDNEEIYIERQIELQSLFEFSNLHQSYAVNSQVDFEYTIQSEQINNEEISVRWDIYTKDGVLLQNNAGDNYVFLYPDIYQVKALFRRNGQDLELKFSHDISILDRLSHEVFNLNTNGYFDGENYAPLIKWSYLPLGVEATIQIVMGNQSVEYSSSDAQYAGLFSNDSFKVPYQDFTLNDRFKYRMKTNISNRYTTFIYYDADIYSENYEFLDNLQGDMYPAEFANRYITNMFDLSKIINYLQIFKEQEAVLEFYFALDYDDIKNDYEQIQEIEYDHSDADIVNAYKLIKASIQTYGIGKLGEISLEKKKSRVVEVSFGLAECPNPSTVQEDNNPKATKIIYDYSYPNTRGVNNNVFPISQNAKTISVKTSSELFFAVSWGMRPIPEPGSKAESIYNEAKDVLNLIIDDYMTDVEKALAIYEYLCLEIEYDKALYDAYIDGTIQEVHTKKSFYLEGVFEEKRAVCDGISKAFVLLTAIENIKAIKISGQAINEGQAPVAHAWNMVMLDGSWYNIDATWGRKLSEKGEELDYVGVNYYYFSPTEEELSTHISVGQKPLSSDERVYEYFIIHNLYLADEEDLDNIISALVIDEDLFVTFIVGYEIPYSFDNLELYLKTYLMANLQSYSARIYAYGEIAIIIFFAT